MFLDHPDLQDPVVSPDLLALMVLMGYPAIRDQEDLRVLLVDPELLEFQDQKDLRARKEKKAIAVFLVS